MKPLDDIIKQVYAYIATLTLDSKVELLRKFANVNITKEGDKFFIDNIEKSIESFTKYVEMRLRWLRISELDSIFEFLNNK